jgi:hypothetical protein
VKPEPETSVIDYVEEEYIDDLNDEEATNDGFENEDGLVRTEDEEDMPWSSPTHVQPKLKKEADKKTKTTSKSSQLIRKL